MNKNRSFIKLGLACLASIGLMISISSAYSLKIHADLQGSEFYSDKILPIHFHDNGNDFGGLMYFTNDWGDEEANAEQVDCVPNDEEDMPEGCYCSEDDGGNITCFFDSSLTDSYDYKVSAGSDAYECAIQVNGFYYNAERGDRLWPMDSNTASIWGLDSNSDFDFEMEGGIYTRCKKAEYDDFFNSCLEAENPQECIEGGQGEYYDAHSYYGTLKHTITIGDVSQDFYLVAGVGYKQETPWIDIKTNELSPTFQRKDNKYPLGLIYDYNGGVGLVGCMVKSESELKNIINRITDDSFAGIEEFFNYYSNRTRAEGMITYRRDDGQEDANGDLIDCKNIGSAADSLIGMIIEGLIGMGTNTEADSIVGNSTSDKMQLFSSVNVNNSALINFTKQKAESLCRGKWKNSIPNNNGNIVCVKDHNITASESSQLKQKGQTLIVKNGSVTIKPEGDTIGEGEVYDIFIDGGDLIIDESEAGSFVIGRNGFYDTSKDRDTFNSSVETSKAEEIASTPEDQLLDFTYHGDEVAVASVIRGNFIVDGQIKGSNATEGVLNNKYFIYGKFTTNQTYDDLAEVFKWRCQGGVANYPTTPTTYCPRYAEKSPYQGAFLVVIDQNYDSPLFW